MKNTSCLTAVLFSFLFLFSTTSSQASPAAEADTIKKVFVIEGQILSGLPFGRPFFLIGDAETTLGDAVDLIEVEIYESKKRKNCEGDRTKRIFSTYWRKKNNATTNKFQILVPERLQFATCYNVVLKYFQQAQLSGKDFGQVVEQLIHDYDKQTGFSGSIKTLTNATRDGIKAALLDSLKQMNDGTNFQLMKVNAQGVEKVLFTQIPDWVINAGDPKSMVFNIGSLIQTEKALKSDEANRATAFTKLQTIRDANGDLFTTLIDTLNAIETRSPDELTSAQIGQLKLFFEDGNTDVDIYNDRNTFRAIFGKLTRQDQSDLFKSLFQNQLSLSKVVGKITAFKADIQAYQKAIDKASNQVNKAFLLIEENDSAQPSDFASQTDQEKSKFSSPISFGGMLLNPEQPDIRQFSGTASLGLRYYFFPVDKGLQNPYLNRHAPFNRMSFALTLLLGGNNYDYRGQSLENAFAGVKPVLALGIDLDHFLTIDFGAVAFKQPSANPLRTDLRWRWAPQIGLSIEFDVFNRVRAGFGDIDYKIPQN